MFEESYPDFLTRLDSDPDRAFRDFYEYTAKLLSAQPPFQVRALTDIEICDLVNEVVLHCVSDGFRVLRQYVDKGRPFGAWLYIMAQHKCIDRIRRNRLVTNAESKPDSESAKSANAGSAHSELNPEEQYRFGAVVEVVRRCIATLGQQCQLLLKLAAEEYTPMEIALALGLDNNSNKKVSDAMRECRRQLRKSLDAQGLDLSAGIPRR